MNTIVWFSWCVLGAGVLIDTLFLARSLFQLGFGRKVTSGLPVFSLVLYLIFVAVRRLVGLPVHWVVVLAVVLFHALVQFFIVPHLFARAAVERDVKQSRNTVDEN